MGLRPVLANRYTSEVMPTSRRPGDYFLIIGRCAVKVLLDPLLQNVNVRGVASTSAAGKGKKGGQPREGIGRTNSEKPTELLIEREFSECFYIPNGLAIRLMDGGPMPTEKELFNVIVFSKEQFNVRFHKPLPSLFRQFLHFMKIPPFFLHPNTVRVLMGCSILDILFRLDLSLLKVFFIYTVNDYYSKRIYFI